MKSKTAGEEQGKRIMYTCPHIPGKICHDYHGWVTRALGLPWDRLEIYNVPPDKRIYKQADIICLWRTVCTDYRNCVKPRQIERAEERTLYLCPNVIEVSSDWKFDDKDGFPVTVAPGCQRWFCPGHSNQIRRSHGVTSDQLNVLENDRIYRVAGRRCNSCHNCRVYDKYLDYLNERYER